MYTWKRLVGRGTTRPVIPNGAQRSEESLFFFGG
jgi:hypothetical protein